MEELQLDFDLCLLQITVLNPGRDIQIPEFSCAFLVG